MATELRSIPYRADLDGLRALAILFVILDHTSFPTQAAVAGVTAFFVLSGYLITSILMNGERVRLGDFYRRRIKRLAPALLVMLAITGTLGLLGFYGGHWQPDRFVASMFYVTNWAVLSGPPFGPTDHTWSLAVEEQFYLSWPLLVAVLSRGRLAIVALVGVFVGLVIRSTAGPEFGYFATPARMDGLLLGSLIALARVHMPRKVGLAGLALLVVTAFSGLRDADLTTVATLAAGMVVASETPLGALAPLGKRAYSLYLWNSPMVLLFGAVGTTLTFIAGELSYRLIERPFMARREVPAVTPAAEPDAVVAPGAALERPSAVRASASS